MNKDDLIGKTSPRVRENLIELSRIAIEEEKEPNWQKNKTPIEIVDKMISKTSVKDKTILVLFNVEFVERLIHKYHVPPEKIFFFADHPLERLFVEAIYGVTATHGGIELMSEENKNGLHPLVKRILEMGQKEFDLVLGNPPFNSNVDLKILNATEKRFKEMIIVHPSTWLIDLKGLSKLYNSFKTNIKNKLKKVELFNGNPIFNIGLFTPCVITHTDNTHSGDIHVDYFGANYKVDNIKDITKFGKEWTTIVKPFMEQIQKYILKNSDVWQHKKSEVDSKKYHCQLAAIRGNVYMPSNSCKDRDIRITGDDFYTLVMQDSEKNKGIRKDGMITFEFNTEEERDNFINYCKTDFARFCLALYKNSQSCHRGEMRLIPWMDFTQEWNDKKLYKFFKIDKKTQEYIEYFLPDYYEIRTKTKEKE